MQTKADTLEFAVFYDFGVELVCYPEIAAALVLAPS